MKKVFLAGTTDGSEWRDELIRDITIEWFNPVVDEVTLETRNEEVKSRSTCDFILHYMTLPMISFLPCAEAVEDSVKRPGSTLYYFQDSMSHLESDSIRAKSLQRIGRMIELNGGTWFRTREDLVNFLNSWNNNQPEVDYHAETTIIFENTNPIESNIKDIKDIIK